MSAPSLAEQISLRRRQLTRGPAPKTGFQEATPAAAADRTPALAVVELGVDAFASAWPDRPKDGEVVKVGLRLLSERDLTYARAEAARVAWLDHPSEDDDEARVDAYNAKLMHVCVARATCQPDDVARPFWQLAEDNAPMALSERGLLRLWEELDELKTIRDPVRREATDAELGALGDMLKSGEVWSRMPLEDARRARRLALRVLETIASALG